MRLRVAFQRHQLRVTIATSCMSLLTTRPTRHEGWPDEYIRGPFIVHSILLTQYVIRSLYRLNVIYQKRAANIVPLNSLSSRSHP